MNIISNYKSIKYSAVVKAIQLAAVTGCGCHWEILEFNIVRDVKSLLERLPVSDVTFVMEACRLAGIDMSEKETARIEEDYASLMAELNS